ncbi:N-acetylmuramoyl-L-alanine amidase [Hymenobacter terricola]|uniref:N-acetylmuramoyl-L-alanine amidase n=1 Tax=Hymenobacter terricola TaxID=2819236 RepID=UPI001B3094FD|nr:N-acetylmuramoyl-L-alanine amidase [Hymenobacter terricola]
MPTWKGIIGASFTPATFDQYCHLLHWLQWRPSFVALHNTEVPTLKQRPNGLTKQHILDLEKYYRDEQGWSAGPHLFVDDHQIWVFTPLTVSGVHSPCFNKVALGVEMLGNYDTEAFDTGRGRLVQNNAVAALATLHAVLGLEPATLKLHKEDVCTTHKHCPGKNVHKAAIIQQVQDLLQERHPGDHLPPPEA